VLDTKVIEEPLLNSQVDVIEPLTIKRFEHKSSKKQDIDYEDELISKKYPKNYRNLDKTPDTQCIYIK